LLQLSKPRQVNDKNAQISRTIIEQELDYSIPKQLVKFDEHSNSLKKLKYKEEFLQAVKE